MREILFRGKRIDNGEWVEGYFCMKYFQDAPHSRHVIQYKTEYSSKEWRPDYMVAEVDPTTVGQFTGLTDKNGKRIFEGDVVRADNGHISQVVYWYDGFCLYCECHKWHTTDVCAPIVEIIGNIHDNPELMEVHHE